MQELFGWLPPIDAALVGALLVSLLLALLMRRRGGRFRGLPGWVGFWVLFSAILACLSRGPVWLSLTLLGLLIFVCLRTYFFIVPMRPRDRWAILAAYAAVPIALYPGFRGSPELFLATIPILLILVLPAILAIGTEQSGLLDSLGRLVLGATLFIFCAPHLALMVRWPRTEVLELFGILVIAAELPQRLTGRLGDGAGKLQPAAGIVASALLAGAAGFWLGPWCDLAAWQAARAGLLVTVAVTLGSWVGTSVVRSLTLGSPVARLVGRGAFLDRVVPAVYAAPVFFHYLNL